MNLSMLVANYDQLGAFLVLSVPAPSLPLSPNDNFLILTNIYSVFKFLQLSHKKKQNKTLN